MNRSLTFLDLGYEEDPVGFIIGFCLMAVASLIAMIQALYETKRPIYQKHTVRWLLPWYAFCMMVENASQAAYSAGRQPIGWWAGVVYALEGTVAPCLLLTTFDATYIIHKTRHLQFCGLYDGQTHTKNPKRSMAIKLLMRIIAVLLLILGLLVNFDVITPSSSYTGRAGWSFVVQQPFTAEQVSVVLSLTPMAVTSLACLYFSLALWKYGTTSSMVVHSSPLNPWFSPLFGTLALIGTQWCGLRLFSILSNLGIFIYTESILYLLLEVNKDLQAAYELNEFLEAFDEMREGERKHKEEHGAEHELHLKQEACDTERPEGELKLSDGNEESKR
jgi:hypothetical protein